MAQDLEWAAERFALLSRYLKDAGEGGLRRELSKRINDATAPILDDIRKGLPDHMPDRYAAVLEADMKLRSSQLAGPYPGVRLSASPQVKARKLRKVDAGILTHPVFGDREHWPSQTDGMTKGFFTGVAERSAPRCREAVIAAVDEIARRVTGGR